jgi:flagellar biosynthesis chaperone FliJ
MTTLHQPVTHAVTLLADLEDGVTLTPPKRLPPITITPALATVFERAAGVAHLQNDPPLTFGTLLIALLSDDDRWLDEHFKEQEVRFDAIARKRPYNETSLRGLTGQDPRLEYGASVSARQALAEAGRIARLASRSTTIDMRHLCAAYPILPGWHLKDFADFQIDRLEWARAYGARMAEEFPQERAFWLTYVDRASPVPLTSFSADVYTQEDLLGIDRSVDALALLIASTRTATPLAVGVFGPWGSGKSFFMRHLQRRIVEIRKTEQPRIESWIAKRQAGTATTDDAPLYFAQIAQVDFNAWHYNEGNLVASLIEHLFRNLRVLPGDTDDELATRRASMLRQLKIVTSDLATVDQTIAQAQQSVDDAKADVERANQEAETARRDVGERASEIETKHAALQRERKKLDDAIQAVELQADGVDPEAVIAVALGPLAPLVSEIRRTIEDFRTQAFDWRDFIARVLSTKGLVVIALCIVAPIVVALTTTLEAQWAVFLGSALTAFAGFGNALDVLKRHRDTFEAKLASLEAEQRERVAQARAAIEAQRAELTRRAETQLSTLTTTLTAQREALAAREAEVDQAAQQLAARAREHESKLTERTEAEKKVRAAEAELERLSSALLLEEFIKDRSSTDEYRKQLGFLALVRRDIERLSKLIDDANRRWLATDNRDDPPLLNRIVLYIDDLDRCKESTVLAVLEAVHLLLAFPLFVCAVAVDPRWVEKCLRETRKQMFIDDDDEPNLAGSRTEGDRRATVGDYLEKIFQIPIWMLPIEERTRANLVNSLLGPTAAPATRSTRAAPHVLTEQPDTQREGAGPNGFNALVARARETPDPLRIAPEEAAFVDDIAEYLSNRPRALKRFVNTYRLLKASLPDLERESFVGTLPSSAYRVCLSQLAFFTTHPRLAAVLVSGVAPSGTVNGDDVAADVGPDDITLADWFRGLDSTTQTGLRRAFELVPGRDQLTLAAFRRWLPLTSRYLFHRAD